MNQLQNFNFNNLQVRTVLIENEPWFVAKDVADILEYSDTQAMTRRLDKEDIMTDKLSGMNMKSTIINESGLYESIIGSKKKETRPFKRWITHEVLPTIRKHGAYMTDAKARDVATGNGLADLLSQAAEQLRAKDLVISEMKPKALFAESVSGSENTILIRDLAKIIKQNGVDIGEKRLFAWLRDNGYLIKKLGKDYNSPTQRSMDLDVLEFTESTVTRSSGETIIRKTPKVTGKGQIYFVNKFLQELEA